MIWRYVLIDGIVISILLGGWILVILKTNPRYGMKSYPPEIVRTVEPQTKTEKKGFLKMALPVLIVSFTYILFSLLNKYDMVASFPVIFIHVFVTLMIWNAIDLLIIDWLIFCHINPDFVIIPGTKGNVAYKNYKYHFIGFIKGAILAIVFALLISGVVYIIQLLK